MHAALAAKPRAKKITKQDLWEVDSEVHCLCLTFSMAFISDAPGVLLPVAFCVLLLVLLLLLLLLVFFFVVVVVVVAGRRRPALTGRRSAIVHALLLAGWRVLLPGQGGKADLCAHRVHGPDP